jgi:hypothetical protein
MSEYIVPDGDEVNFVLLDYLVPDGDEVNFRFGTIEKVFDDTSETSDDIDLKLVYVRLLSESIESTDLILNSISIFKNELVNSSETINKNSTKNFLDLSETSDDINKNIMHELSDNLEVQDESLKKNIEKIIISIVTGVDEFTRLVNYFREIVEILSSIDFFSKQTQKNILDNIESSDLKYFSLEKFLFEETNIIDHFGRLVNYFRDFLDLSETSETIKKSLERNFLDLSETSEIIKKSLERNFLDLSETSETIKKNSTKNFLDLSETSDNIFKKINIFLEDLSETSDDIFKKINMFLEDLSETSDLFYAAKVIDLFDNFGVSEDICLNQIKAVIFDIKKDLVDVLFDLMNEEVGLIKETNLNDGDFVDDIIETKFCVQCRLVPVSEKERNILSLGKITTGVLTGYFLPSYTFRGIVYEVEENDLIFDGKNNIEYRVLKIYQREHLNNEVVYIKALLQRI